MLSLASCNDQPGPKKPIPVAQAETDSLQTVLNLLQTDSLNPALWKKQYELFLEKKDTMKALLSLRRYNYLAPEDGDGWLEMAWLLAERKDRGALIITDSLSFVKDETIRTRAQYIRGLYYSNMGQDDKALNAFDSTIVHNYTFIDAYIEKGIIQYNHKKYNESLKTFQQAFKIANNNAELYYWIGKSYEGLGNTAEAADWQKKYEALK
jgi:tetratricopeptide (TPR) repeat protein